MRTFFLIYFLISAAFAQDLCLDPMNPYSHISLTEQQRVTAECRFLLCDLSAQQGVLGGGEAAICSSAYELIYKKIYHSDFSLFLEWWNSNKGELNFNSMCTDETMQSETWIGYTSSSTVCTP